MFCKNCGQQLSDGQRFCHKCGTQVNVSVQADEPSREPLRAASPYVVNSSQNQVSSTTNTILAYVGVLGGFLTFLPAIFGSKMFKEMSAESLDLILAIGELLYGVVVIAFLLQVTQKIKNEGLTKPSTTILMANIVTTMLAILSGFATIGSGFNDEFTIWSLINFVDFVAWIVLAVAFLISDGTKSIGGWILLTAICMVILLFMFDSGDSVASQKSISKFVLFAFIYPTWKMFESFKNYLSQK